MRPRLSSVPLILVFRCHPQVKYTPGCGGRRRRRTGWRCRMRATTWTAGGGRRTRRARTAAPVPTSPAGFPHDVLSRRRPRPPPAPGGRARRCPPGRGSACRGSASGGGRAPAAPDARDHRVSWRRAAGGGRTEQGWQRRCPRAGSSAGAHELAGFPQDVLARQRSRPPPVPGGRPRRSPSGRRASATWMPGAQRSSWRR